MLIHKLRSRFKILLNHCNLLMSRDVFDVAHAKVSKFYHCYYFIPSVYIIQNHVKNFFQKLLAEYLETFGQGFKTHYYYYHYYYYYYYYYSKPKRRLLHYLYDFARSFVNFFSHYQVLVYENACKYILNNFPTAI